MANPDANRRRLIVNADDFGRSPGINQAVIQAHREGILTTASLMVNEPACAEAIALAKENPALGVGLHLTFLIGHSALPPEKIPGLVNARGEFSVSPVSTGLNYFFRPALRKQLRAEIHAQFARFRATGLKLDHVNGHLHMHLHPVVFGILMKDTAALGLTHLRLTREPFWLDASLRGGHRFYRACHSVIYAILARAAQRRLHANGIRHTHHVFGLLQNARVDEEYVSKLLPLLPPGDSELYLHPSVNEFPQELGAMISPQIRKLMDREKIELIRYQDL